MTSPFPGESGGSRFRLARFATGSNIPTLFSARADFHLANFKRDAAGEKRIFRFATRAWHAADGQTLSTDGRYGLFPVIPAERCEFRHISRQIEHCGPSAVFYNAGLSAVAGRAA